ALAVEDDLRAVLGAVAEGGKDAVAAALDSEGVALHQAALRRSSSRLAFHLRSSSIVGCRVIQSRNPPSTSAHFFPRSLPMGQVGRRRGSRVQATISRAETFASRAASVHAVT